MRKRPESELILEIANELAVDPSFVEKDWFAVQVIAAIASTDFDGITPIFSGGTSLSKGYGRIQRFSEDIDFKLTSNGGLTRGQKRAFRENVVALIKELPDIEVLEVQSRNASNFFACNIQYPQDQELSGALRAHLKLEMTFQQLPEKPETRKIQSFVNQFIEEGHEAEIACVSPIETAADKFSALLWRIQARDRTVELGAAENDPTMARHLHDLCALSDLVDSSEGFVRLVTSAYEADRGRGASDANMELAEAIDTALVRLNGEAKAYEAEYSQFVDAMSYAPDNEKITFNQAITTFRQIAKKFE